jgi:hypothetical protein
MSVILAKPPPSFITEKSESSRIAKSIVFYCLMIFIQDCKDLVSNALTRDIQRQLRISPLASHASRRKQALSSWLKSTNALAWNESNTGDITSTYSNLVLALADTPDTLDSGLLKVKESWNYQHLAQHLIDSVTTGIQLSAPIIKKGFFVTAFPIALKEINHLLDQNQEKPSSKVTALIAYMLQKMQIHFVPWHKPSSSTQRGRAPHAVSHNHWMFINHSSTHITPAQKLALYKSDPDARLKEIVAIASTSDTSAPWSVPDSLQDMGSLWKKVVLPEEWNVKNASLDKLDNQSGAAYVLDTYEYVELTYNGNLWKHHMGLVWAILFSAILPNVFYPKEMKDTIALLKGTEKVTRAICNLPWTKTTVEKRKGITVKAPYITMLSTAIIALLDNESPLRKYMDNNKNTLGKYWTDKHGKFIVSLSSVQFSNGVLVDTGSKEINAVMFIRTGLALAMRPGVLSVAKYKSNWEIKGDKELKELYKIVMEHLGKEDYGVYFAIEEIFGVEMADEVAKNGHAKKPMLGRG